MKLLSGFFSGWGILLESLDGCYSNFKRSSLFLIKGENVLIYWTANIECSCVKGAVGQFSGEDQDAVLALEELKPCRENQYQIIEECPRRGIAEYSGSLGEV